MSDDRHGGLGDELPESDAGPAVPADDEPSHDARPRPDLYKLAAGDTSKVFTGIDTSKFFTGIDTSKVIAGIDTSKWMTAFDTSKLFARNDTSKWATTVDTSKLFARNDTSKWATTVDTSKLFAGIDTNKLIAGIDTSTWVTAFDTSKLFAGIDTNKLIAGNDTSTWVTAFDTSKLFRSISGNLRPGVNWRRLTSAIDWSTLDERIDEIEHAFDDAPPSDDFTSINLDAAVEQVQEDLAASGQHVSRRHAKRLVLVTIAVYIAFALALHVTNVISVENPIFDPHQLVTDESVAIGLALAVYGAFRKQ